MNKKVSFPIATIIITVLSIIVGGGVLAYQYWWLPKGEAKNFQKPVTCTQEAKVCPDGSAVGRTGPNCEFSPCLNAKDDETADWETYTNNEYGFEIKYPNTFSNTVWNAQTWPPSVKVFYKNEDPLKGCGDTIYTLNQVVSHQNKVIGNMNYIVYKGTDAGAGNLYSEYCYVLGKENRYYVISFIIHSINGCGNGGCGPVCGTDREAACKNFDIIKEVEKPIEKIVSTFKFVN